MRTHWGKNRFGITDALQFRHEIFIWIKQVIKYGKKQKKFRHEIFIWIKQVIKYGKKTNGRANNLAITHLYLIFLQVL